MKEELQAVDPEIIVEVEEPTEVLYGEVLDYEKRKVKIDVKGVANKVLRALDFADFIKNIDVDAEYVLVIPEEFRKGLENGENWIMENAKNNDLFWPNIMRTNKDGKKVVAKPLGLKKKDVVKGNPLDDLSQQCNNAYLQGQMQQMAERLEEAIEAIKLVEQGQEADRIGLLTSGKELLYLAMHQEDEESRKTALLNAMQNISTAKGQMYEVFKKRAASYEQIPSSSFMQFLKIMQSAKSDYLTRNGLEYMALQRYYDGFAEATNLIASTYLFMGDKTSAENAYAISLSEMSKVDTSKLETAKHIPEKYLPSGRDGICESVIAPIEADKIKCFEQNNETLRIEITGQMLLDAAKEEEE